MRKKFKEIGIKKDMYYFFNDTVNIKNLDPNKMEIDEKSNKNILINYIKFVTDNLSYANN